MCNSRCVAHEDIESIQAELQNSSIRVSVGLPAPLIYECGETRSTSM
jgi:hypothetical protein